VVSTGGGDDHHPRVSQAGELLDVQQLVADAAVERLHVRVLPRRARLDERRLGLREPTPVTERVRGQLRAVVHLRCPRKSRKEALRCLKRHLARRVWKLRSPDPDQNPRSNNNINTKNTPAPITGNAPYFIPCAR
jgi:hypothetical protein